jgi:hypothetical protein
MPLAEVIGGQLHGIFVAGGQQGGNAVYLQVDQR